MSMNDYQRSVMTAGLKAPGLRVRVKAGESGRRAGRQCAPALKPSGVIGTKLPPSSEYCEGSCTARTCDEAQLAQVSGGAGCGGGAREGQQHRARARRPPAPAAALLSAARDAAAGRGLGARRPAARLPHAGWAGDDRGEGAMSRPSQANGPAGWIPKACVKRIKITNVSCELEAASGHSAKPPF